MLKEIFTSQRQFINYFFDKVALEEAELVLAEFLKCKGMIVFTGVGKSGVIAEKLSKTMVSIGIRSIYLPPTGAFHGDIGILSQDDLVVILSKSGKGEEILEFTGLLKKRGTKSMAWISAQNSPLAILVDHAIHLPLEREICPFDLAPTTSTAVQLIFGDIIAVALMRAKQFSIDQFALNHPGGAIGKLIAERVEDVMITGLDLPISFENMKISEVLVELSQKRCGCLMIVDDAMHLIGVFTDGDLRRAMEKYGKEAFDCTMAKVMTKKFLSIDKESLTSQALQKMQGDKKITMLPVLENGKLIGLIHLHHILCDFGVENRKLLKS